MTTEPFVTFTPDFIATKYPGYFFNIKDEKLYSMKVDGVLKPLRFHRPNHFNHMHQYLFKLKDGTRVQLTGGYYVSVKGRKRLYPLEELKELEHVPSVIPVKEEV